MTARSRFWASEDGPRRDAHKNAVLRDLAKTRGFGGIESNHRAEIPSAGALAIIAAIACPILLLVFSVGAALSLVAWPFTPAWVYVAQRKKIREARQREDADMVQAGAYPGEPGCSVIAEIGADLEPERSRGLIVEQIPRHAAHCRLDEYMAWIDAQRVAEGKEPLWTPARL